MKPGCECCEQILERVKEVYADLRRAYLFAGSGKDEYEEIEALEDAIKDAIVNLKRLMEELS